MKLCELVKDLYLKHGNMACYLKVESDEIREEFSAEYEGKKISPAGVSGRVSDVPAYYGGYEVQFSAIVHDCILGEDEAVIYI